MLFVAGLQNSFALVSRATAACLQPYFALFRSRARTDEVEGSVWHESCGLERGHAQDLVLVLREGREVLQSRLQIPLPILRRVRINCVPTVNQEHLGHGELAQPAHAALAVADPDLGVYAIEPHILCELVEVLEAAHRSKQVPSVATARAWTRSWLGSDVVLRARECKRGWTDS